jgi:ribosomal-protein-alanine N-acetyltransferase
VGGRDGARLKSPPEPAKLASRHQAVRVPTSPLEYPSLYPVTLTGERITLRELSTEDAPAAFAWGGDSEWFTYLPFEAVATVADEVTFLAAREIEAHEQPRIQYQLGIVWHENDELVGGARLGITAPSHRGGDIGYGVRRDLWGRGIASEAASLLVDFGFRTLGLHRIAAVHHPDNLASGRVLQKIGMQFEGRHRDHMYAHGTWRDSLAYAILEDEWREKGSAALGPG